jgi:predicted transcriptional regulator of viral defense system
MAESTSGLLSKLSQFAESQGGFLTAAQARSVGVDREPLKRLAKQGFLEREQRGLYRLSHFPADEKAELWRALLWPTLDRSDWMCAILCYGTALSLYGVSTINPSKIDVAVPRNARFRRSTPPPPGLQVHQKNYPPEDITRVESLPATTLFRTIADLIATNAMTQFVDEALDNACTRTLLTGKEFDTLKAMRVLDERAVSFLQV